MLVGQFHHDYQFFHLFVVVFLVLFIHLEDLGSILSILQALHQFVRVLPLVSLQVVGKIDCWGLKVFISWKNFLASLLL